MNKEEVCPFCGHTPSWGHHDDCADKLLAALLDAWNALGEISGAAEDLSSQASAVWSDEAQAAALRIDAILSREGER